MTRAGAVPCLILAVVLTGCVENTAPGNDREASLEPPPVPAELASASEATSGVSTHLLKAETMTEPDLRNVPDMAEACVFHYTEVGFPVFVYGPRTGVIKLNGKLVPLPAQAPGEYRDAGVSVTVHPLDEADRVGEGQFPAEFVLRFEGAPNELGFHGFSEC